MKKTSVTISIFIAMTTVALAMGSRPADVKVNTLQVMNKPGKNAVVIDTYVKGDVVSIASSSCLNFKTKATIFLNDDGTPQYPKINRKNIYCPIGTHTGGTGWVPGSTIVPQI